MVKKIKKTKKFTHQWLKNKIASGQHITRRDVRKFIVQNMYKGQHFYFGTYWFVDFSSIPNTLALGKCGMPGTYEEAKKRFFKDIYLYLAGFNGKVDEVIAVEKTKEQTIPTEIMIEAQAEAEIERNWEAEREHKMEVQMERDNY